MNQKSNCEFCSYYNYDEILDCCYCSVNLDEDEMERFLRRSTEGCPYFNLYDEYKIVRRQN